MGFHDWKIIEIPKWLIKIERVSVVPYMRACKRPGCTAKQKQKSTGPNKGQWYNIAEV
jgi:hypothetical protein